MSRVLVLYNRRETSREVSGFLSYLAGPRVRVAVTFDAGAVSEFGNAPRGFLQQPFESFSMLVVLIGPAGIDRDRTSDRLALEAARRQGLPTVLALAENTPAPEDLANLPRVAANFWQQQAAADEHAATLRQSLGDTSPASPGLNLPAGVSLDKSGQVLTDGWTDADFEREYETYKNLPLADRRDANSPEQTAPTGGQDRRRTNLFIEREEFLRKLERHKRAKELLEQARNKQTGDPTEEPLASNVLGRLSPNQNQPNDILTNEPGIPEDPPGIEEETSDEDTEVLIVGDQADLGDLGDLGGDLGGYGGDIDEDDTSLFDGEIDSLHSDAPAAAGDTKGDTIESSGELVILFRGPDRKRNEVYSIQGVASDSDDSADEPEDSVIEEITPVRFDAYFPPTAEIGGRYALIVYARIDNETMALEVTQDVQRFRDELGGSVPRPRQARKKLQIRPGTLLTVVPECAELQFEPGSLQKRWQGDWTRFAFDFRPDETYLDETALCRVAIQISGIEIAHINCAIEIVGTVEPPAKATPGLTPASESSPRAMKSGLAPTSFATPGPPDNPLARERARLSSNSASLYMNIFISYSRRDLNVTHAYLDAQVALGNSIFIDTETIRVGENWRLALARAIDEADVFQLFWSRHSARSENVQDEWNYALQYRCAGNDCAGFIRPVYWNEPPPPPPAELSHLHFKYVPLLKHTGRN